MKSVTKMILSAIFAVCTLSFGACVGGNLPSGNTGLQPTPGMTPNTTPITTPDETAVTTPSASTTPAVTPKPTVIPEGAVKWINKAQNPEQILMNYEQIQAMNTKIRAGCDALVDIASHKTEMSAVEIKALIETSSGPSLPKFDKNGTEITSSQLNEIKANRNLNVLSEKIGSGDITLKRGITVQRANIRALPTSVEFYNSADVQDHDRMQESELSAASAVLILHTSADGKFYFIQSYYYIGWVEAADVAVDASVSDPESDWVTFAKLLNMSENITKDMEFIVITESLITVDGVKLDMGTALPLTKKQKDSGDTYRVILPGKDESGKFIRSEADIPVESANLGYLEYSLKNFYAQAFKYSGTPYGWGGMKDRVDCSGYVLSVFKTFGFVFPRNTGQQNKVVGSAVDVESMSVSDKIFMLSEISNPVVIYISGHAMIYLGTIEGTHYIIHAPGGGVVREDTYDGFSSLIRICEVG